MGTAANTKAVMKMVEAVAMTVKVVPMTSFNYMMTMDQKKQ